MTANTPTHRAITAGSANAPGQVADEAPDVPDTAWADAVRSRIALAAEALGEAMSADDREAALGLRDTEIAAMWPLVPFAVKHDLSHDWLFLGDVRPMLARAARSPETE